MLEHGLEGKPVALIVNEIGEVGIDGKVVTGLSTVEKMVELSSGCICCSIDEYRFDLAIQEIVETAKPHLIIIESTGLADPEPLAYRVKSAGLGLDAIITVVDAANVERQLARDRGRAGADRGRRLPGGQQDRPGRRGDGSRRVERRLARLNPRAERFRTRARRDRRRRAVRDRRRDATASAARTTSAHLHADGFGELRLPDAAAAPAGGRSSACSTTLPADVIRAKGIVRLVDRDWHCLFNVTCGRHELGWLKLDDAAAAESQAVFIGRDARPASPRHRGRRWPRARPTSRGAPSMAERHPQEADRAEEPPTPRRRPTDAGVHRRGRSRGPEASRGPRLRRVA